MKNKFRLIMGKNCISEVLKSTPERLVEVYTSHKSSQDSLYTLLIENNIPVRERSKKELERLVESESHQSYVAAVKEIHQPDLKSFLKKSSDLDSSLVVMLDSIFDPHNLGAIFRAAECFGVDLIVFSKNRGTDVTPVATKTSVGATELVPFSKVSNLAESLKLFKDAGYWVVGAEGTEGAESIYDFQFPEKTLLILGSEGKGIQQILSKKSDFHVKIPMAGHIDSVNVSQAAAIFLSHARK
jgi:23S rRNA (guanosine2251-2'-O)-methyltransferase